MLTTNQEYFNNVHNKRKKETNSSSEELDIKKSKVSTAITVFNTSANINMLSDNKKKPPANLKDWLMTFHSWSHHERIVAFDSLVNSEICDIQQMRYLLSIIEPQLQRDFISLLPKELSLYVLSFLQPADLLRAAQTCRYWRFLCEDNLLWREKCREEGLLEDNETLSDLFAHRISKSLNTSCPDLKLSSLDTNSVSSKNAHHPSNWIRSEYKLAYLRHKNIEYNWRFGILNYSGNDSDPGQAFAEDLSIHENSASFGDNNNKCSNAAEFKCLNLSIAHKTKPRRLKEVLHLKGHEDHVITCLQFNATSNIIVSGSDDNTLKVWSSINGRCLRTLYGHTGGVWSSQLSLDNIVISGSTDRTLRVWNALNGHCLHTLYGHTSTVRCMSLHENHVVSGSRDATLRVWNIDSGKCVHVLVGHMAAVRCVQFNGVLCVSGAYDYLVKVWDVATETCLHTLEGHTNRVYSLQFDGTHIVSGSLDTSIRVWCAESGELKHTLIGHQSLTSGMQLKNNILVSGNADSTVKVWDISTGRCLQTLSGINKHQSAVTCLQFNTKFVITSSDDGTVKLWDLKTGEFIRNLVTLPSGGSGGVVWRIRASNTKLVCAVGSRNGTEETKLLVLDFETFPSSLSDLTSSDFHRTLTSHDFMENNLNKSSNFLYENFFQSHPHHSVDSSSVDDHVASFHKFCNHVCFNSDQHKMPQTQSINIQQEQSNVSATNTNSSASSSLSSTPSSSQMILPSISLQSISSTSSTATNLNNGSLEKKNSSGKPAENQEAAAIDSHMVESFDLPTENDVVMIPFHPFRTSNDDEDSRNSDDHSQPMIAES